MSRFFVALAVVLLAVSSISPGYAQLYKYTTPDGAVHFTDDPSKIPEPYQTSAQRREGGSTSMLQRVKIYDKQVIVPVTISYRGRSVQAELLLDTGAMNCTISPDLAKRLNIPLEDSRMNLAQVAGGGILLVGSTRVDTMQVGPKTLSDVEVAVLAAGNHDGLLGMNFLGEFHYQVNMAEQTILWSK